MARAAELNRKAGYIKRMDWIEGLRWELPSEFEQYMFLVQLQAEEDAREARREEERALRAGEESSDSEGSSSGSASSSDYGEGEESSRGQYSDRGLEEDDRSDDLEPPSSRDIADFGRAREFEDMKIRLEELHRNARAFSVRPLFEEAGIFDGEDDDITEANGEHGAQGIGCT